MINILVGETLSQLVEFLMSFPKLVLPFIVLLHGSIVLVKPVCKDKELVVDGDFRL